MSPKTVYHSRVKRNAKRKGLELTYCKNLNYESKWRNEKSAERLEEETALKGKGMKRVIDEKEQSIKERREEFCLDV